MVAEGRGGVARRFLVFLTAGICISAVIPATAGANGEHSPAQWVHRPSLDHARGGLGVATVRGRIYAIGGFRNEDVLAVTESRRTSGRGEWHPVPPMHTARSNHATAELGGRAYAIGGIDPGQRSLATVEAFDPERGRWLPAPSLPEVRDGAGAASLDGVLYVVGGEAGPSSRVTGSVLTYRSAQRTWKPVAAMPTPRTRLRLVASEHFLYAIGGRGLDGASLTTVERYDPRVNRWSSVAGMKESRLLPCAVETTVGGRKVLVVAGGVELAPGEVFVDGRRTSEVFDPARGRWKLLDALFPVVRGSHDCATESDGTVLAIGGETNVGNSFFFLDNVDALKLTPRDLRP
ncbi:kelch repeat-containing protein [Amycolatopsis rhabdoformis]|uniref:Kelch repeat-containing protein n=1 Tax=Amycolatopsis rhabdoformis TaxID=1448059 RepID=A0ABZ1IDZ3_9PSEU|nr:kelch repeat-containing protein [Amycolatopsis rhabdoformis]WSE32637.1 kelch repeat-containing protein [Amycolatopsis rhabdoformis]